MLAAVVFTMASASSAFPAATVTVGGTIAGDRSGLTSAIPDASVTTFNNWNYPDNYQLSDDGHIAQFLGAPGSDYTPYLAFSTGTVVITFTTPIKYFGLYWGSIDPYNQIAFTNNLGETYSYSGSAVTGLSGSSCNHPSEYVNFFSDNGETWTSVTLSSTRCDLFGFDNVAFSAAPEPAAVTTAGLGIGLALFGVLRRRTSTPRRVPKHSL